VRYILLFALAKNQGAKVSTQTKNKGYLDTIKNGFRKISENIGLELRQKT
jgi:hypothetical protein